jgi:hypothetical protein
MTKTVTLLNAEGQLTIQTEDSVTEWIIQTEDSVTEWITADADTVMELQQ